MTLVKHHKSGGVVTLVAVIVGLLLVLCFAYLMMNKRLIKQTQPTPSATNSSNQTTCKPIDPDPETTIKYIQICTLPTNNRLQKRELRYKDKTVVPFVDSYSISPVKKWVFVVGYSKEYATTNPGAPDEEALYMIDARSGEVTNLFSQIYFTNFYATPVNDLSSWSYTGDGVVFTAGPASQPLDLTDSDPYSVVYCTTTCKVLAKDAGPIGVGANPAFFQNGKVIYTNKEGKMKFISFLSSRDSQLIELIAKRAGVSFDKVIISALKYEKDNWIAVNAGVKGTPSGAAYIFKITNNKPSLIFVGQMCPARDLIERENIPQDILFIMDNSGCK